MFDGQLIIFAGGKETGFNAINDRYLNYMDVCPSVRTSGWTQELRDKTMDDKIDVYPFTLSADKIIGWNV